MLGKNIYEGGAYFQTQGFATTPWPDCGEIDIMEHWGKKQDYIQSALHTPSSSGATVNHGGHNVPNASNDFHLYAVEWTSEKIVFSVDSAVHYIYNPTVKDSNTWPFDAEHYLLLNFAIESTISSSFTQDTMQIDYVRVYKKPVVSIAENTEITPTYFPNPVSNTITLEMENFKEREVNFNLYSIQGILVKNYRVKSNKNKAVIDDLNDLPAGLYLLNYKIEGKNYTVKFIKS